MRRPYIIVVVLFCLTASLSAQHVTWQPEAPRIGDAVTINYDTRPAGGLEPSVSQIWLHWGVYHPSDQSWSTPPQSIWPAGSRLHTDNVAVQSPMTRGADSVFHVSIDFDTTVHDVAFVFTDGQNAWDNNNGSNWIIAFIQQGTVSWWTPEEPEPGDEITVFYDAVPGTLPNGSTSVILHWGINEAGHGNWRLPPESMWPAGTVASGSAARSPMTALGNGLFTIAITTLDTIYSLHYVTTDGTNWDNNGNANWDIFLEEPPPLTYTWEIFRFDPRSAFSQFQGQINTLNLAGAFNGWSTSATPLTNADAYGNLWGEVRMPVGTNEYKFVINGNNWQIDPDNPRNAPGYNNSLIELAVDSLPQVYDIQPGENRVFDYGTPVIVSVKVRSGDRGPGISGTPSVRVNQAEWPVTWNAQTGTLTLNPLPSNVILAEVAITASDSAGRTATRYLNYGFDNDTGYLAVDARNNELYTTTESVDLRDFGIYDFADGDSVEIRARFFDNLTTNTMVLLTITTETGSYGAVGGMEAEYEIAGLASGGVIIPLLSPQSPFFDSTIHNRIHYGSIGGTSEPVTVEVAATALGCYVAVSDLENVLGNYQTAWQFTCASLVAAGSADGYCEEISAAAGGIEGEQEPDIYDIIFMQAADVQTKMADNYGLSRRMTLDAPGRGIAAVLPEEIGPNVSHPGPLCRILTRGAPTLDTTQTIVARITSPVALTQTWLSQNGATTPVTMAGDSFVVPVMLEEDENRFEAWAVDANGDTGRSASMVFTLVIDHAPRITITTRQEGLQGAMDASATTDPESQIISYQWLPDPANPVDVTLSGANTSVARFPFPAVSGEYYFDLIASDPDQHSSRGRTLFTIRGNTIDGFGINEAVDWAMNAIIYEIFPRSFSATGDLAGITADMQRIADLGVNCIWLMPVFEGPSDHGYEITDYYHIEQDYGTEQDLRDLVQAAHERGVRVMLDMVLNHTGIGHPFMQDCLRYGRYSHYWNYYDRDANGNYTYYFDWLSLPNLNLNNPEAAKYFIDMCVYWVEEFEIDGYRCDVAWGPMQRSPQFWVDWRTALKTVKPECLLLAEAGANDFNIFTNRFDEAFDWNLHHEGGGAFSRWFPSVPSFDGLTDLVTNYNVPWPPYKNPLRFLENHDETRFIAENTAPQTQLAASFYLTIPGAVMLYAGQEVGTSSQRGAITWTSDPNNMYPHYYRLVQARKQIPALREGAWTQLTNNAAAACYSYARYGTGMDPCVWVGNFSGSPQTVRVTLDPVQLGLHSDSTYVVSDVLGGNHYSTTGAAFTSILTSLAAYQSQLWVVSDSIVSVDAPSLKALLPDKVQLYPAYPNPFNPTTTLAFDLTSASHVTLKIYDLLGRKVTTLADGVFTAGTHQLTWNAADSNRTVGSGIYFAVFNAPGIQHIQKLVLLR